VEKRHTFYTLSIGSAVHELEEMHMDVRPIQAFQAADLLARAARDKTKSKPAVAEPPKDIFQPSGDTDRSALLDAVKKRIKSGYYNSKDVIDDLGESFAKVFDKNL
jgi:hypothetical protein